MHEHCLRHEGYNRAQCGPGPGLTEYRLLRCSKQAGGAGRQDSQPTMRGYYIASSLQLEHIWGTIDTPIASLQQHSG